MSGFLCYDDVQSITNYIAGHIEDIPSWYVDYFKNNGVQGLAGLLDIKFMELGDTDADGGRDRRSDGGRSTDTDGRSSDENDSDNHRNNQPELKNISAVFKISKYLNFVIQNEGIVMEKMNEMRRYIPHFCCSFGYYNIPVSSYYYAEKTNPFDRSEIYVDVLITEYIEGSSTFCKMIIDNPYIEVISALKQLLIAIYISQEKLRFTHYDLHTDNILINSCNRKTLFVYILSKDHIYVVPTYGNIPVIIDYGFSYTENSIDKPLCNTLKHTTSGYLSTIFDSIVDPKLLLVNTGIELSEERNNDEIYDIARSLYKTSKYIDWKTGWDSKDNNDALDEVIDILEETSSRSSSSSSEDEKKKVSVFENHLEAILEMIQYLIQLPLKSKHSNYNNIKGYYKNIRKELESLEKEVKDELVMLYIIQQIIMSISKYKSEFLKKPSGVAEKIKDDIFHKIIKILPFYELDIDIVFLANNMLNMADYMESIFYNNVKDMISDKKKDYKKVKDPLEILSLLPSTSTEIDTDTPIYFFDMMTEKMVKKYPSGLHCKYFNKLVEGDRGKYLYKYLY